MQSKAFCLIILYLIVLKGEKKNMKNLKEDIIEEENGEGKKGKLKQKERELDKI